jgi:hypothetical protein
MKLLTKGLFGGTVIAVAAWAVLSPSLQKPAHPPSNNSMRPTTVTFTVHFGPAARGTAISWSAGFFDDDTIADTSPWIWTVAIVEGQRWALAAEPSRSADGERVWIECWVHNGDGRQIAHQPKTTRSLGCQLHGTA